MKIGIYINDSGFARVRLDHPDKGNPGIGGTQYLFALLVQQYHLAFPDDEILLFHRSPNDYPSVNSIKIVSNIQEAAAYSSGANCDCFLYHCDETDDSLCSLFDSLRLKSIAWAHNFVNAATLRLLRKHKFFWRIVFVGKEQYDKYIDSWSIYKCATIENMCPVPNESFGFRTTHNVVYTGALRRAKGFHILASQWKSILEKVPDAQLFVAGSGRLYDRSIKLGPYGIAEEAYENEFMQYLLDREGNILPSVHFLGIVSDKEALYKTARVGVANPTGISETLCLSAIEMEAYGVPVVSAKKKGLLDAVRNKETGLLTNSKEKLAHYIIRLLSDDSLYRRLSENGPTYVKQRFDPLAIIKQWHKLFEDVTSGKRYTRFVFNPRHLLSNGKIFRYFNHLFKFLVPFLPSTVLLSSWYSTIKGKLHRH